MLGIAEGLRYLHERHEPVVHSDLKAVGLPLLWVSPVLLTIEKENVLMTKSGTPLLCDFGIFRMAVYTQSALKSTTQANFAGSLNWAAPEFFDDAEVVKHATETDVWAFGMVVYVCLLFYSTITPSS